jgi:hypothetical protein
MSTWGNLSRKFRVLSVAMRRLVGAGRSGIKSRFAGRRLVGSKAQRDLSPAAAEMAGKVLAFIRSQNQM